MAATHHVYAICWGGGNRRYLQEEFYGNRYRCEKFLKDRVRAGRMTHFLFISKMDIDKATRRYL
jgi:hypothetical protein